MDEPEPDEAVISLDPVPIYDVNYSETNLQRYFRYFKNSEGKMRAECLKCNTTVSRANYGTTKMLEHLKKCDADAWTKVTETKDRKNASTPNSRTISTKQPKIDLLFKVGQLEN